MLKIKICGITNVNDALLAVNAGADALGFIFYRKSPRYLTPEAARNIVEQLPPFIATVGVFVNEDKEVIQSTVEKAQLSLVQLHGDESPSDCIGLSRPVLKAIRVRDRKDVIAIKNYTVKGFVLDAYIDGMWGGTGERLDWRLAKEATQYGCVILAGGLTPVNVGEAVSQVQPFGVDVSSGVESTPGKKDPDKVRSFIVEARRDIR